MHQLSKQMKIEYELIEKQLDVISKAIFSIDANTNIIEHDIMHLSGLIENLGLSIEEMEDKHGTIN